MALSIYKSGQGYWTRMLTAVGALTLALSGVGWFATRILTRMDWARDNLLYWQAGIGAGVILLIGVLLWFLLNKPKIADFMIATENEMKKVNWPTKKAVIGLTWVVIAGTLLIALLLFVINTLFTYLFQAIDILHT
jgi:preprotein translocase subunit SecE